MAHPPTPEQSDILDAVTSSKTSIMVRAGAGCGKTTMLEMISRVMPPSASVLALAFNVSTKKNMEKRFPQNFHVKTLNGLGHNAWGKAIGKRMGIEENKLGNLVTAVVKESKIDVSKDQWDGIRRMVAAAMNQGLIPQQFSRNYRGLIEDRNDVWTDIADDLFIDYAPFMIDLAREVLVRQIKMSFDGIINYDDQIYMSALFGGVFPRYNDVLVDEGQDLSPLNHIQVKRCAAGRLIVVGDQAQSIYAFRGADHESLEKLRGLRQEWINLPLMLTFRCPKRVVERQQEHVPGFRAHETNAEGTVLNWRNENRWDFAMLDTTKPHPNAEIAILCRNNAPLLSVAFKLIKNGIGCKMIGRDLGKGLVALSRKIMPLNDIPSADCVRLINEWADNEMNIARANQKEGKVEGIQDRRDCLLAVLESGNIRNSGDLRQAIDDLFSRVTGKVTLSTGHRAKGLEWDTVLFLDPFLIPSKGALRAADHGNEAALKQELNLKYVIETRSKHTLVLANSEDFDA